MTVNLLVVDDDDIDSLAVKRAFRKANIANPIYTAADGIQALAALRGEAGKAKIPRPFLILLDLNMPRMTGHEFLEELRADEELRDSVVFVLSTSSDRLDIEQAYRKNVAGYIVKSALSRGFQDLVDFVHGYWKTVELPCR